MTRAAKHQARGAGRAPFLARVNRLTVDACFATLLLVNFALAGWLMARHDAAWDWTGSGRNSLSAESLEVLADLKDEVSITVYAPAGGRIARAVEPVLARYARESPRVRIEYVDPQLFPELARAADIRLQGQLVLEYRNKRETLGVLSETAVTNAIARLLLDERSWIAVLEGHGERAIDSPDATGIGRLADMLRQRGFWLQPVDLARHPKVPDNTDVLIITTPTIPLFPGEAEALIDYVGHGGNLLWLLDPAGADGLLGLEPLRDYLGIKLLPGQVVDAAAGDLNLDAPTIAVVDDWPEHALGRDLIGPALLPGAAAFDVRAGADWTLEASLATGALSWNETGPVRGEIARDTASGERNGPLSVALVLTRSAPKDGPEAAVAAQRVVVLGDGDFLSSAQIERGVNKVFALRLVRWLAHREDLIAVPAAPADPSQIALPPARADATVAIALVLAPLILAMLGLGIRWLRERA